MAVAPSNSFSFWILWHILSQLKKSIMKSLNFYLAILIAIVLFVSCKKNDVARHPVCNITTVNAGTGDPFNISYNSEGKIASVTQGTISKNFQFSGNTLVINETNSGGFANKYIVTLNEFGLATNVKNEETADGTDWNNLQFEYNGKEVVKQTSTTSAGGATDITTITWTNGNPTSIAHGGNASTIEYYADKPSQAGDYWNLIQLINNGFYFIASKNAMKSLVAGGVRTNLFYTSDADGKFTGVIVDDGTPPVSTYTYQYQCN